MCVCVCVACIDYPARVVVPFFLFSSLFLFIPSSSTSSLFFLPWLSCCRPGLSCFQPNKYDDEDGIKRVSFMRDDTSSIDDRIESPVNPRLSGSSLIQFTALDPVDAPVDRLSSSHLSSSFKTKTSSIKRDCCCTSGPLLLFPIMFST